MVIIVENLGVVGGVTMVEMRDKDQANSHRKGANASKSEPGQGQEFGIGQTKC